MNNKIEKFLPLGSVVLLSGATKRLMITGFCPVDEENEVYDYCGCMYPEGVLSSDETALFNHSQIDKIYFMGLNDKEEKVFKENLNKQIKEVNESVVVVK